MYVVRWALRTRMQQWATRRLFNPKHFSVMRCKSSVRAHVKFCTQPPPCNSRCQRPSFKRGGKALPGVTGFVFCTQTSNRLVKEGGRVVGPGALVGCRIMGPRAVVVEMRHGCDIEHLSSKRQNKSCFYAGCRRPRKFTRRQKCAENLACQYQTVQARNGILIRRAYPEKTVRTVGLKSEILCRGTKENQIDP